MIVPSEKLKKIEKGYGIKCPIEVVPTGISLGNYQKELLQDEKKVKRMGLNSLKRSVEFDVKVFAHRIERIYQRALSA